MAEGIDEAARAFQTEIGPPAPPPAHRDRDEGGRFTAKPEPMFGLRPIEGDPLTGDTRDGGDDARLAAIERRIADGRAEEGDEAELRRSVSDAARARNAARDERHRGEQNEPQERIGQEPGDQDAQGNDEAGEPEAERGDAEGASEQDAESQFRITTLDGKPVEKFEVQVDGQPAEVSLDEALRGYIREQTFHQRMNKIDQARQAVEQQAAETGQVRQRYIEQCQHLAQMLNEVLPPQPNWEEERRRDPAGAWDRRQAYEAVYGRINDLNQRAAQAQAEARQEYDRNSQRYAVDQFSQFVQEAKIPDEKALNERVTRMRAYGRRMGFNEGELATVYDKRMLRVLDHAAMYDQMMAARPKAVIPGRGKTLTPGLATPPGNAGRKSIDDAQNKLAKTGRLEDAALVMSRLIR